MLHFSAKNLVVKEGAQLVLGEEKVLGVLMKTFFFQALKLFSFFYFKVWRSLRNAHGDAEGARGWRRARV